jgi:hypothetical protein
MGLAALGKVGAPDNVNAILGRTAEEEEAKFAPVTQRLAAMN